MARNPVRSVINNWVCTRTYMRRRSAFAPRRRVAFSGIYRKGISAWILNQLLGEGKWHETLGFTPT